ncbi:MAG: ABC transporter ATP-binding protein [Syntrophomonadaceae bacterium]|nr:ABC transporter ATP-binding protein [Syntrophomonadaceae bacterium]
MHESNPIQEKGLISIQGVDKIFVSERGHRVHALSNTWIEVAEKDFICIVGPSGCGKSTLLRIVAGLEQASSGQVLFQEQVQNKPHPQIGMVFQQYSLLPWRTVEENIILGLEIDRSSAHKKKETAERYLELINMKQFRHSYPFELSGGMQQRVAIARALANDPQVLLMDEPFGALDAHTRILMQRELLRIWEKNIKTVLFVTHSVDEAIYLADRILVMSARPGQVKEIIDVDMPRPRTRSNPRYGQLSEHILDMLEFDNISQSDTNNEYFSEVHA